MGWLQNPIEESPVRSLSFVSDDMSEVKESTQNEVLLESVLLCPVCGFAKRELMPTDACQFFLRMR